MSEYSSATKHSALLIKDVLGSLNEQYFLPIFQRDFVWAREGPHKTLLLFDSLMQDYPISNIMLWKVPKENIKDYAFFKFLKEVGLDYHHGTRHGELVKGGEINKEEIIAVLDGQQRLTSLYIGFKGVYNWKDYRKAKGNPYNYPERKLYVNLYPEENDSDRKYSFEFRKEEDSQDPYWFRVGEICDWKEEDIDKYIEKNLEGKEDPKETLKKLYKIYHEAKIEASVREDKEAATVLKIFERANTAGDSLSFLDLLVSYLSQYWQVKAAKVPLKDALAKTVGELFRQKDPYPEDKDKGKINRFNFDTSFVLKSCLVLAGCKTIEFSLKNVTDTNAGIIYENWDAIVKALERSVDLLEEFGFDHKKLTARPAVLPIAYYFMEIDKDAEHLSGEDKSAIERFLYLTLFKRVLRGGRADHFLRETREIIKDRKNGFPLEAIQDALGLSVDEKYIDNLLAHVRHDERAHDEIPNCTQVLYLISPDKELYMKGWHVDHIFPRRDHHAQNYCEALKNLQLLDNHLNGKKSAGPPREWYEEKLDDSEKKRIAENNFFPDNVTDLLSRGAQVFTDKREELLRARLKKLLMDPIS